MVRWLSGLIFMVCEHIVRKRDIVEGYSRTKPSTLRILPVGHFHTMAYRSLCYHRAGFSDPTQVITKRSKNGIPKQATGSEI